MDIVNYLRQNLLTFLIMVNLSIYNILSETPCYLKEDSRFNLDGSFSKVFKIFLGSSDLKVRWIFTHFG